MRPGSSDLVRAAACLIATGLGIGLSGCEANPPLGVYRCVDHSCPTGQFCHADGLCYGELERPATTAGRAAQGPWTSGAPATVLVDAGSALATALTDAATITERLVQLPDAARALPPDAALTSVTLLSPDAANDSRDAEAPETNTDLCAQGHGGCDNLVSCSASHGRVVCGACPPGYEDVRADGTDCRDIDECARGTHTCSRSPAVACTNVAGSFACGACPAGYVGDGHVCTGCPPGMVLGDAQSCQRGFVLLDATYTATTDNTRDSKYDTTPSLTAPANWRSPVDYVGRDGRGMVQITLNVLDKPSSAKTLFNVCLENSSNYACMPYPPAYKASGALTFTAPFNTFFQYSAVDWTKRISKVSLVLKDQDQNIPATRDTATTALFYPTTIHVVLTVLPPE